MATTGPNITPPSSTWSKVKSAYGLVKKSYQTSKELRGICDSTQKILDTWKSGAKK